MAKPLCFDLYCGLGGFTSGFLEEGWDCVGFDIERHIYGDQKYPAQLVLQDVLTLHGRQFKDASCIVASPPCQFFSYCAMPWSRAKQLAADVRADPVRLAKELALFNACFRIQREASEAAGHHIPMVVENVVGAQAWVGPAKAHYGSFYLWGDVDQVGNRIIAGKLRFGEALRARRQGVKVPGMDWSKFGEPGYKAEAFNTTAEQRMREGAVKVPSESGRRTDPGNGTRFTLRVCGIESGIQCDGDWFNDSQPSLSRLYSSRSPARKAASAEIAKIPLALSRHLARSFKE